MVNRICTSAAEVSHATTAGFAPSAVLLVYGMVTNISGKLAFLWAVHDAAQLTAENGNDEQAKKQTLHEKDHLNRRAMHKEQ